jgi:cyclohexyl-isocyanide hydratase
MVKCALHAQFLIRALVVRMMRSISRRGWGQEQLMDDDQVLAFIRAQAAHARYIFSVCTGALICGAAGLLRGVHAITHWSAFHLLEYFGAIPTDERVIVDGKHVSAAGVTAGIDGALRVV